ncbi:hypothetical protein HUN01_32150 [Nostoc edaphicum CCNP1411]|uniref:Uncharacterized protein n=1 Tax=Nostoc edaphicum CCNP1411 TaxID=1472755 RepID=A0A7D7LHR6_9NOSO|nr:hypothetical protein [Nostoc edaphicum]QMS92030.1 hypothetical protein HUN01_32150 [Nostoc edaphicum CCNP1411]
MWELFIEVSGKNLEKTITVGHTTVNEWNFEMVLYVASEINLIIGNFLGLLLEFPWLRRVALASHLL